MSAHAFAPGREPGRCARCGCAEAEAVHGGAGSMTVGISEWMAEHKGPLIRTVGEVWYCGDDWCGCTQAQIVEIYRNLKPPPGAPQAVVRVAVWEGEFRTDHKPGAEADLRARGDELRLADPDAAARVEWHVSE